MPPRKATKKWMAIFDTHGDMAHLPGLKAALEFAKVWKPAIRIAGGDHFDLRPLRKKSEDAIDETLNDDMAAGLDFISQWKPTVYLYGNHEDRLRQWQERGGIWERAAWPIEESLRKALPSNCQVFEYCKDRGVFKLGNIKVVHGYSAGIHALRKHTLSYGNVIMGHIHANDIVRVESHDRAIGFSSGCLCRLNMDYNRAQLGTMRQSHGILYGFTTGCGKTHVHQAYPVDGSWWFPTEMMEISNG